MISGKPGEASVSRVRAPGTTQFDTTSYRANSLAAIWLSVTMPDFAGP